MLLLLAMVELSGCEVSPNFLCNLRESIEGIFPAWTACLCVRVRVCECVCVAVGGVGGVGSLFLLLFCDALDDHRTGPLRWLMASWIGSKWRLSGHRERCDHHARVRGEGGENPQVRLIRVRWAHLWVSRVLDCRGKVGTMLRALSSDTVED